MKDHRSLLLLLLGLLVIAVIPSHESVWIDEAVTATYAREGSFSAFAEKLIQDPNSEAQMPFYVLQSWSFGKLIGTSEWALRAPNILYGMLAFASFHWIGRRLKIGWFGLLLLVQPYFWAYVDEARPYASQIGFASLALASLIPFFEDWGDKRKATMFLSLSLFLLCGSSMLGAITAGWVYLALIALLLAGKCRISRTEISILCGGLFLLGCLGAYDLWTLLRGSGGSRIWDVGLQNLGFSLYEFAGATGLGPARAVLREMGKAGDYGALLSDTWLGSLLLGGILGGLLVSWLVQQIRNREILTLSLPRACLWIAVGSGLSLLALSYLAGWPFWGRHLAPAFPFFILWLGCAIRDLRGRRPAIGLAVSVALSVLWLASSLRLRFSEEHHRDDYRGAARLAHEAYEDGLIVWWVASPAGGAYYHLPAASMNSRGVRYIVNASEADLRDLAEPDLIVLSKPDVTDSRGSVRTYILVHGYSVYKTLPAFQLFRTMKSSCSQRARQEIADCVWRIQYDAREWPWRNEAGVIDSLQKRYGDV